MLFGLVQIELLGSSLTRKMLDLAISAASGPQGLQVLRRGKYISVSSPREEETPTKEAATREEKNLDSTFQGPRTATKPSPPLTLLPLRRWSPRNPLYEAPSALFNCLSWNHSKGNLRSSPQPQRSQIRKSSQMIWLQVNNGCHGSISKNQLSTIFQLAL